MTKPIIMKNHFSFYLLSAFIFSTLLSSCGSVKHTELIMFQDVANDLAAIDSFPILKIRTDDILSIQVSSRKPELVQAFQMRQNNLGNAGEKALGTQEGYRVDEEGNIHIPFLGQIQAAGKRIIELRKEISSRLMDFIPDVSVEIRFTNFRVTLMGEVNRPNTYTIPNQRLTILEAIGMAGDFTSYARRNSVLIIRERNEVREFERINMQDKTLFESDFFYLNPNDIVYVEPLKAKQYATQGDFVQRYSTLLWPIISLATFTIGIVAANQK